MQANKKLKLSATASIPEPDAAESDVGEGANDDDADVEDIKAPIVIEDCDETEDDGLDSAADEDVGGGPAHTGGETTSASKRKREDAPREELNEVMKFISLYLCFGDFF